jgi:hypothetical protein
MTLLLLLIAFWLVLVAVRFRASRAVLIGGLVVVAAVAFGLIAYGDLEPKTLGLAAPRSWPLTLGLSVGWVLLMLITTPLADWIATRFFATPPTLEACRAIQESRLKLAVGIVIAWILGGSSRSLRCGELSCGRSRRSSRPSPGRRRWSSPSAWPLPAPS